MSATQISHGHLYEHAKLGTVVLLGEEFGKAGKVRVCTHRDWRETPLTLWNPSKRRDSVHTDFPVPVHVIDRDELVDRPRSDGDVERFMREHRTPRWKPAPLPKFRALPKLSEEKFAALMREHGATRIS